MAQVRSKPKLPGAAKAKKRAAPAARPGPEISAAVLRSRLILAWTAAHGRADWVPVSGVSPKVKEVLWPLPGRLSGQRLAGLLERLAKPKGPLEWMPSSSASGAKCYRLRVPSSHPGAPPTPPGPLVAPPGRARGGPPIGRAAAPAPAEEPPGPAGATLDRLVGAWLNRFVAAWAATHGLAEWVSASNVSREVKEAIWPGGRPSGQMLAGVLRGMAGREGPLERMPSSSAPKSLCYRLKVPAPAAPPEPAEEPPPAPPPGGARIQRAALEASLASADLAGMAGAAAQGLIRGMGGRDAAALAAAALETAAALLRAHLRSAELAEALERARPQWAAP